MEEYQYSDKEIQNEKHLSVLNVPVEIPVSELESQINAKIKGLIYEDNSYEDDGNEKENVSHCWGGYPYLIVTW